MAKILIARGQATIYVQKDGYTITQSLGEYVFPADDTGKILSSVTLTSTVRVMCGDEELTAFTIGAVGKPAGFSSVTVNNGTKTLTYVITAGTTTLADHGTIDIPVTISGIVYHLSFVWSKAKAGIPGKDGVDADMLDWVKEWNTGKTLINGNTVITPKLFAGTKNSDGTVSGIAIGSFTLNTKTSSGTIAAEAVNGIYGFRDGYKTFYVDNGGNAQLGYGDQYVRYNATTGKVEFGSGVSLNWVGATYIDKDGSEKTPVVLHRAILGSLDRFMAYLIEETKGRFPTWLAPTQVKVLPVSEKTLDYARTVADKLTAAGVRVVLDESNEKIGYKIFATEGTAKVLTDAGVKAMTVNKIEQESPNLLDLILGHKIDLVIDIPAQGAEHSRDGFVIRRNAIETGVNVLTAIDTAYALITSLENTDIKKLSLIDIAKVQ